jgi:tripartite-type tricarboxylate transporter receptor subunit TctC
MDSNHDGPQRLSRRTFLGASAGGAIALGSFGGIPVWGQGFLGQSVTLVVPFPAGGTTDLVARVLAEALADRLKQSVLIDNRPGGGGNVAAEYVVRAKPDGLTILFAPLTIMAVAQYMYSKLRYSPERDLLPVGLVAKLPNVLIVPANSPITSVAELVSKLKLSGAKMQYGSPGIGTSPHLCAELFKFVASVKSNHTAYPGAAQAIADLIAGRLDYMFDNLPTALAHVKSGRVKALAVTSSSRTPLLPDVPTVFEAGLLGYQVTTWFSLALPVGTPLGLAERTNRALVGALGDSTVKAKLLSFGAEPATGQAREFETFLAAERRKWSRLVKAAAIRADA